MDEPEEPSAQWRLARWEERELILAALALAVERWREILDLIADAADPAAAQTQISTRFGLNEAQAMAVMDSQYRRLTQQERQRVQSELAQVRQQIAALKRSSSGYAAPGSGQS